MNTKQLKAKVLDLAIHGKLLSPETVAELKKSPDYETADVLLEKIRKEKEEKIAKGELKRDKKDSYIFVGDDKRHYEKFADGTVKNIEDEIPFDVPEGWAWARLNNVGLITDTGYPFNASEFSKDQTKGMAIIRIRDILRGYSETYSNEKCPESYIVNKGEILIGMDGDFNIAKWKSEPALLNQRVCRIKKCHSSINLDYFFYLLEIPLKEINKNTSSVTVKHLSNKQIENLLFPIPPIKIQNEIVAKIQQSLSLVEIIENGRNDIETTIKKTKSKILDLAIHGKLVPQDSNDEPASILLEKLRAEKEEKIAKGELKRDKNDSYIYKGSDNCYYEKLNGKEICIDDEIPFEIPESWIWKRGKEIFLPMFTRTPGKTGTFKYIDIDAIDNKQHKIICPKTIEAIKAPSRASRGVDTGDVLFSLVRPYLENIALIKEEHSDCIASTGFYVCKPNRAIYPEYLFYLMTSKYVIKGLNEFMKGDNSPSISGDDVSKWLYPIPPIEEQKRIVKIIKNLYTCLEQIQNNCI